MKKILIIEDDKVLANIYRNKLAVEHYQVEVADTGETGLARMRTFKPHMIFLDLVLPQMSGVEVLRHIRSEADFAKIPVVVFSNAFLTNAVQEAWKAGATKCLSKADCSPKDVLEIAQQTLGPGDSRDSQETRQASKKAKASADAAGDVQFQSDLRQTVVESLPATVVALRGSVQQLSRASDEVTRLKEIYELHRRIHALYGNTGIAGLVLIARFSGALEALLKEMYEKPKNISSSSLRTAAAAVDFLGFLFKAGIAPEMQELSPAQILVVDDEAISRRAIVYSLEKAELSSIGVSDPNEAMNLLSKNHYDLVFLDVNMPEMNGFEVCAKLRKIPQHLKTPVLFVTALSDFDSRTSSTMAGGNDFIGKPFLFIELTVKALMHVMRGKLSGTGTK